MLRVFIAAMVLGFAPAGAQVGRAASVIVAVSGEEDRADDIACRLYAGPDGFPDGPGMAAQRVARPHGPAACRFDGLAPGVYAVVVAQLPHGQADVLRDWLGRPRQPWGVSNDVRPHLRAPRFDEAAFRITTAGDTQVHIRIAR